MFRCVSYIAIMQLEITVWVNTKKHNKTEKALSFQPSMNKIFSVIVPACASNTIRSLLLTAGLVGHGFLGI